MPAHNLSGCVNHLILPKIVKKLKECDSLCVGENTERFIFFFAQKKF